MAPEVRAPANHKEATQEAARKSDIQDQRFNNGQLSRHELLHHARGLMEASHRCKLSMRLERYTFCTTTTNVDPPDDMKLFLVAGSVPGICTRQKVDILCNKSVPFYILNGAQRTHHGFRRALGNFIYRKWFQPYKSDIDYGRFLAAFICPADIECSGTRPASWMIDALADNNKRLCDFADSARDEVVAELEDPESSDNEFPSIAEENLGFAGVYKHQYRVEPLFGAISVVVCVDNWRDEGSRDIGRMPVFLALTGRLEGLSSPITFDSIWDQVDAVLQLGERITVQTTLETAVGFLVKLEQRERLSARPYPEVPRDGKAYLDRYDRYFEDYAHYFKDSAPLGSSTEWVDTAIYTEWSGEGYLQDLQEHGFEEFWSDADKRLLAAFKKKRESALQAQSRL